MRAARLCGALAFAALAASCGPQSAEEARAATIAKCERQFGRMVPDASGAEALCTCMADEMAARDMEITDVFTEGRDALDAVVKNCASRAGIPVPAR